MKKYLLFFKLKLKDYLLLLGAIIFAVIIGLRQGVIHHYTESFFPLWIFIPLAIVMIGCFGYYIYVEVFRSKGKVNLIIPSIFCALMFLNIITILSQPSSSDILTIVRLPYKGFEVGDIVSANLVITGQQKVYFIFEIAALMLAVYIALFVAPKRYKDHKPIILYINVFTVVLISMIIYSFIAESSHYANFFKYFFGGDHSLKLYEDCTVHSYVFHRNGYAMVLFVGMMMLMVNNHLSKRLFNYIMIGVYYICMLFTISKTSLILATIALIVYFIYQMVITFKQHRKRNIIASSVVGTILLALIIVIGVPIISKGKVIPSIYELYETIFRGGATLTSRGYIWDNINQLLQNGWWLIGRGHGVINLFILPMNAATHNEGTVFQTSSSIYELIGEGGILYLFGFIAILGYAGILIYKTYKIDKRLTFIATLGIVLFLIYCLFDTIHYIIYLFIFILATTYQIGKKKENSEIA